MEEQEQEMPLDTNRVPDWFDETRAWFEQPWLEPESV